MYISKKDALTWFSFFAALPEDEPLLTRQQEIAYAVFAQIEAAVDDRCRRLREEITGLKSMAGRTFYVGEEKRFPKGCRSCLTGTGLSAVRKTNKCNLHCKFCYDYGELNAIPPIGEGLWEIGGTRFYEQDIDLLLSVQKKPTGIAYVYLEPFMEIEKYYGIIRKFHEAGVYQHMYTNGVLATEENLAALGEAGLDELRFNLGATDCADKVIESIRTAKRFIPMVGVETPMTRDFYKQLFEKKSAILSTGLDFFNCAELHLNANNLANYAGENMYLTRLGYLSPVYSHELTLNVMKTAADERWAPAVHDCCNMTKLARDLNLRGKEGGWFGASGYGCEFDRIPYAAFLSVLQDEGFAFLKEEPLPQGYRPGDLVL